MDLKPLTGHTVINGLLFFSSLQAPVLLVQVRGPHCSAFPGECYFSSSSFDAHLELKTTSVGGYSRLSTGDVSFLTYRVSFIGWYFTSVLSCFYLFFRP